MGGEFSPNNIDNPDGNFEDMEFWRMYWYLENREVETRQREKMIQYVINKRRLDKPWGWKHPAVADFIDEHIRYARTAHYIWCQRDTADAIRSFRKAFNYEGYWPLEKVKALFDKRDEAKEKIENIHVVQFEDLLKSPREEIEKIINFTNLNVEEEKKEEATLLVNPNYSKSSTWK